MKTKQEIINHIINHIQDHGRSIDHDGRCRYYNNGNMCAVGVCLENPEEFSNNVATDAGTLLSNRGFGILKKQFRIKNINFWLDLQSLHDYCRFWESDRSLSQHGIDALMQFKEHTKTDKNKTLLF